MIIITDEAWCCILDWSYNKRFFWSLFNLFIYAVIMFTVDKTFIITIGLLLSLLLLLLMRFIFSFMYLNNGTFSFRMTHGPTLVRWLALVGGTQLVYSGEDGGCQAEYHVILRLQSGQIFALQVGEGGRSTFTKICCCKRKRLSTAFAVSWGKSGNKPRTEWEIMTHTFLCELSVDSFISTYLFCVFLSKLVQVMWKE